MAVFDNVKRILILSVMIAGFLISFASGIVNYDNDPDLAVALKYDFEMNGGEAKIADRALAEKYYLAYLTKNPDVESFQKARIYAQLGALYAVAMNRQRGEKRDREKARQYFEKVLECEPERIEYMTLRARNMLVDLRTKAGFDRLKAGLEYYEFLDNLSKLDKESIQKLWLPKCPVSEIDEEILEDNQGESKTDITKIKKASGKAHESFYESEISGLSDFINTSKHNLVRNATDCDAAVMDSPIEGLTYILEHLPDDAPERAIVEDAINRLVDLTVDEELQNILDSFISDYQEELRKKNILDADNGYDLQKERFAVKSRFIPHFDFAVKNRLPFIFDLASGKSIYMAVKDKLNIDKEQLSSDLVAMGNGDLIWNGDPLTTRNAQLFSAAMEEKRPLEWITGNYGGNYKLPEKVDLPYTLLASNKEGRHYLIRIAKISPEGITILYREISTSEMIGFKLVMKESGK